MATRQSAATAREMRLEKDRIESCIAALRMARSLHALAGLPVAGIDTLIGDADARRTRLARVLGIAHLESRKRATLPKSQGLVRPQYRVFVDECGGHAPPKETDFGAFCLCAVVIEEQAYESFRLEWEEFKNRHLAKPRAAHRPGGPILTHEPSLRPGKDLEYRLGSSGNGVARFERDLRRLWNSTPITVIAAVIDTRAYYEKYGEDPVDAYLPSSVYAMALDFVMERVVHFLAGDNKGGFGHVVAEGREKRADALLQYEYVRLHLEGTQFASDAWFRQQLHPTIDFRGKSDNVAGLQVADLMARPIAEKVLAPRQGNRRWTYVKRLVYDGGQGRPESYGLKAFPRPVPRAVFK